MNLHNVFYDGLSEAVGKEELEHKLETYIALTAEIEKEFIHLMLLVIVSNQMLFLITFHQTDYTSSSLLDSIRLLISIVILLAFVITVIWQSAAKRAKVREVTNILTANKRYGEVINQVQREILKTLRNGTHNEQLTSS